MNTTAPRMSVYRERIRTATGAPDADLELIERIMREEIFHSTLDWQTESQFDEGARLARQRLDSDRDLYESDRAARAALFRHMQEAFRSDPSR